MRVSLVGFMGTGKSSIGVLLAQRLKLEFIDTDIVIEKKTALSIPEIFSRKGERYFRQLETEVLRETFKSNNNFVLATGGGIVIPAENRRLLLEKTFAILLTASPEEIYQRIKGKNRPLLATFDPPKKIKELLSKRNKYYQEFSKQVDTAGKTKLKIVEEIIAIMEADVVARGKSEDPGKGN